MSHIVITISSSSYLVRQLHNYELKQSKATVSAVLFLGHHEALYQV
jgi:hypothetical protein